MQYITRRAFVVFIKYYLHLYSQTLITHHEHRKTNSLYHTRNSSDPIISIHIYIYNTFYIMSLDKVK